MFVQIDLSKCNICGKCIDACPEGAIIRSDNKILIDEERCTLCKRCLDVCPMDAIIEVAQVTHEKGETALTFVEDKPIEIQPIPTVKETRISDAMKRLVPGFLDLVIQFLDRNMTSNADKKHENNRSKRNRRRRHGR